MNKASQQEMKIYRDEIEKKKEQISAAKCKHKRQMSALFENHKEQVKNCSSEYDKLKL